MPHLAQPATSSKRLRLIKTSKALSTGSSRQRVMAAIEPTFNGDATARPPQDGWFQYAAVREAPALTQ
jgi:hypothetical protein